MHISQFVQFTGVSHLSLGQLEELVRVLRIRRSHLRPHLGIEDVQLTTGETVRAAFRVRGKRVELQSARITPAT